MTHTNPMTNSGWRERWARRENERRAAAYEQALSAWWSDDSELRQMLAAAQGFYGIALDQVPPSIGLRRDETLYWFAPNTRMVEVKYQPVLPAPGYEYSLDQVRGPFTAEPPGQSEVADAGLVAITNQRVIFQGGWRGREWTFANLVGLAHEATTSCTLMQVTNRQRVSGLLLDPSTVAGFRFNLALAFADGSGDRAGFMAYVANLLGEHQQFAPQQPVVVAPEQAPHPLRGGLDLLRTLYLGPTGASVGRRTAQAATAAAVSLLLISFVLPSSADTSAPTAGSTASTPPDTTIQPTTGVPTATSSSPSPTEQPTQTPTRRASESATPTPTMSAPTVKAIPLCGAPKNPYGYNFCDGSYVTNPNSGTCHYFDCIDSFWDGEGYMIQCRDGAYSMSGGRPGSCAGHGGDKRAVYH